MKKYIWLLTIVLLVILAILDYMGFIWHNDLFAMKYEIKGLDVSHHQGDIDWKVVQEKNNFKFVYIKATEGRDFVDDQFAYNWQEARKQGMLTGAYHFFSMRSSGEEQAKNFINIVPEQADSLPPVIDVEIHLNHDKDKVRQELRKMAAKLEQHYKKRPILYVTYDTYHTYVEGGFSEFQIWIRDIYKFPTLGNRKWLLWQYCNRGRIDGIDTYVDINAFNGDMKEFEKVFGK
ncbi:GH25 family lysozyme [Paenactinomyces guangxiensis]|uniref:Glycoside hydrolase n=1 Tax=Paenactinomyces guangxiensis TaxID=1490290 RepID=A0A7W2A5W6_9BACL|nr:GH25 family lysozyme [Paenactinomyces guangxiensis]MBA4492751.1 glycoside hydrolase [Paenactinomyces guangxiensis]MBH8590400.1 glycoside hydrolase [Paenactinomyces guangxiensis]